MSLYNIPSSVWQLFNDAQPEYRMDTDEEMDNKQAMQEFLNKLGVMPENVISDDGTQVTLTHGQFDHYLVVDCGGLGDCYSHRFTISENQTAAATDTAKGMPDEKLCDYCAAPAVTVVNRCNLCADCAKAYDNKTGYCSLECCISGKCDESC